MSLHAAPTLSFLATLAVAQVAAAAPVTPPAQTTERAETSEQDERRARAEDCFERGREAGAAGSWAEAASWFERSLEFRSSPEALYSLGVAQRRAGLEAEAWNTFRRFLALPPPDELAPFVDASQRAVRELEPEVGQLRIAASVERVLVDGEPVSPSSPTFAVAPGPHVVQLTTRDGRTDERTVTVEPGQTLELGHEPPRPQPPEEGEAAAGDGDHAPLGWALVGVGSGLFAAGLTTGFVGVQQADGARAGTPAGDEARRLGIAGDSLAVIGGVTAAVGAGWLLFGGSADERADVAVVPYGAGLAVRGSWDAF